MRRLKFAIRALLANKQNTVFSLVGMTIGMCSFALIVIWLYSHWSFDRFHKEVDQIYFVQNLDTVWNDHDIVMPFPLAEAMRENIPQLENTATVSLWADSYKLAVGDKLFYEKVTSVENQLLDILDFQMISQRPNPLSKPTDIAISSSIAEKFFGTTDCVGKSLTLDEDKLVEVSAVFQDFPQNSSFNFKIICQYTLDPELFINCTGWNNYCYGTLTKVPKGSDLTALGEAVDQVVGREKDDKSGIFSLYPFTAYHLNPPGETSKSGHLIMVFLSGLLVLLVSCINFVNLQTATLFKRNKEMGIKKMLGATSGSVIAESLLETALFVSFSLLLSLLLSALLLPFISDAIDLNISAILGFEGVALLELAAALVVYILVALYLAFIVMRRMFNRITLVDSTKTVGLNRASSVFVVFQFAFTIFIGISAFIMQKQLSFAINSDKGFDVENIVNVETWDYPFEQNRAAIKEYLDSNSDVVSYSIAERAFNTLGARTTGFADPAWSEEENNFYKVMYRCDENLLETMGIELVAGRFFEPEKYDPKGRIVINETFAKLLGGGDVAIGKRLKNGDTNYEVIGVCDDFLFENFYTEIEPLVMIYNTSWSCSPLIKTVPGKELQVAEGISKFLQSKSDAPFKVSTMRSLLSNLYDEENRQNQLLMLFCILTIMISCLGLLGITIFIVENRTKEIGVRKVNGATVGQIIRMLSRSFLKWVVYAYIIAAPLTYIFMQKWLSGFAYRVELTVWEFLFAAIFALFIALITVSWQCWRAARRNPVESLRYE